MDRLPQALITPRPAAADLAPLAGTEAFLGYGREVTDDEAFRFDGLGPRTDGLFLKLSYLFRN